ncbi:hypothetical protein Pcinc_022061, partial [Petrolisthes cinctipes]
VGGAAVLGVGIWTVSAKHDYVSLLRTINYATTSYLLLVAGVVALVAALLACCAVLREDRCCLLVYTFLVLVVLVVEGAAGVLAYVYEEQIMDELSHTLPVTFVTHYQVDPTVTNAIDKMQVEYECCGAVIFSEWRDSVWLKSDPELNNTVPDSCCKTPSPYCGVRDHPSNIWYNGCIHRLEEELARHLLVMGAVGCGLCLLQVFGILLACCLYIRLRDLDDHYY